MDKLLVKLNLKGCQFCSKEKDNCKFCNYLLKGEYEPNDTIKEIDRLIKLGRRYDENMEYEIKRAKECRWAKEVK